MSSEPAIVDSAAVEDEIVEDVALSMLIERRGRTPTPLHMAYLRDLTPKDIELLANAPPASPQALQALRQPHHALARLLAQGIKPIEASAITGYSLPRIVHLANHDPMFRDLIAHYAEEVRREYFDMQARIASLGATAVEMMQEKLEDTPLEQLSLKTLREIAEFAAGGAKAAAQGARNGAGGVQVTVNFVGSHQQDSDPPLVDVTPQKTLEGPQE